jgi:methylated-DNA-[protein]-cysteine S-methyltransferase
MPSVPSQIEYRLFPTSLGPCGIAWGEAGIRAVQLPEVDEARTCARLLRAMPAARPGRSAPSVQRVIDDIIQLLDGVRRDLRHAVLDMQHLTAFQQHVYAVARTIEPGHTLCYGEVAALCGDPGAARAVGQALGSNPFPLIVPCHRVLAAHGRSGGFSARGGVATKLKLLRLEGWNGQSDILGSPATLALPF